MDFRLCVSNKISGGMGPMADVPQPHSFYQVHEIIESRDSHDSLRLYSNVTNIPHVLDQGGPCTSAPPVQDTWDIGKCLTVGFLMWH